MFGPSYLGIAQWAVAADPHPSLRALAPAITSARVRAFTYPAGAFSLDSTLTWLATLARQRRTGLRRLRDQFDGAHAPGARFAARYRSPRPTSRSPASVVPFYQDWLARAGRRRLLGAGRIRASSRRRLGAGDHGDGLVRHVPAGTARRLSRASRRRARGADHHRALEARRSRSCQGEPPRRPRLVRRAPAGTRRRARRRGCASSSVAHDDGSTWTTGRRRRGGCTGTSTRTARLHPRPPGGVAAGPLPLRSRRPHAVGGRQPARQSGRPRDNRALERRQRRARLHLACAGPRRRGHRRRLRAAARALRPSSTPTFSCASATSSHRERRATSATGWCASHRRRGIERTMASRPWTVELWPAAHLFRRDHRIRVQVSSGAHPRFARNLGGGEPLRVGDDDACRRRRRSGTTPITPRRSCCRSGTPPSGRLRRPPGPCDGCRSSACSADRASVLGTASRLRSHCWWRRTRTVPGGASGPSSPPRAGRILDGGLLVVIVVEGDEVDRRDQRSW